MSKGIKAINVQPEVVAKALEPIEARVYAMETADAGEEAARLIAEHGLKPRKAVADEQ